MKFLKVLTIMAAICICFASSNAEASQRTLYATNSTNENIYLAMSYLNQHQVWVRAGWVEIRPGSTLQYKLNTNNEIMYVYAYSQSRTWSGYEGDPNAIWLTVVNNHFNVKGNQNPSGQGQRSVLFDALMLDGQPNFEVTFSASQYHD